MKIKWAKQASGETHIYVENSDNRNSGYPIGSCRQFLAKKGFKWKVDPWFNTGGLDFGVTRDEYENDIEAGRALAQLFIAVEKHRLIAEEEEQLLEDVYYGDIMPYSGSD
tara:strand:- start:33 stop:362 length:330 start_codon:yes stop_codon:yes gene_type:complete